MIMPTRVRILVTIFFVFTTGALYPQAFQWAKDIKSVGFDEGLDLVTDPDGYVYVGGQIEFDADFGNNVILHSAGKHDIFIAKYDPIGNLVWAKRAGGKGGDKAHSIALDGSGHIFAVGEFEDTSYWDGIMKATPGMGINNMFVAKYDTSGSVMWVRNISAGSGPLHTRGYGVTCDAQGNVYACGGTNGDAYYNGTFLFTTAGDYDGTVVKFDPNGNFCWARRMGGVGSDKAYGIASDNNGSIYVTGYFVGTADFASSRTLVGNGHTDIFLAKFDTAGTLQWVKQAGDTGFDRGWDVTINVNGQIVITGEFQTGYFGSNLVHSHGNEDMFLAAYDNNGNNLWALSGGGVEDDIGRGVSHDNSGNIYVVGDYASTGSFPPLSVSSNGFADIFLAKYSSTGIDLDWIRTVGGHDNDRGRGVGADNAGNIYICGEFVDSTRFDSFNLIGDTLLDIFVAKVVQGSFCSAQVSTTILNPCNGFCDGSATASAIGHGPFMYNWSTTPAQFNATVTGLCAGIYSVTMTDVVGCTATAVVTLTDPPLIQLTATSTGVTCNGSCNGIATASATGQGPFTFSWSTSPPQSGSIITGLCAGIYSVIATDTLRCTSTASVTLIDPQPIQLSSTIRDPSCSGTCDGILKISATGQSPFNYVWSTSPPQSGYIAANLCAGTYLVTTTDALGCTSTASLILTDPSQIQVSATILNASCAGCSDGIIDLHVSGGTGVFNYSWSNGNTTQDLQNLTAGIYNVCVIDSNNCSLCDTFTVLEPSNGILSFFSNEGISIFPNPFKSFTTIKLNIPGNHSTKLVVYNTIGESVFVTEFYGNEFHLPANELKSGIYFLHLDNDFYSGRNFFPIVVEE